MAKKVMIQIYRGIERDIGVLKEGELGYCTDTQKLYIGTSAGNVLLVAAQTAGDMLKSIYDTNNDGVIDIADRAKTINGFTVDANVPSNAKFTDTVYSHPNSGVSAGTYKSVTVNAQGHVTGGTNPTTLWGYGITDAVTKENPSTSGELSHGLRGIGTVGSGSSTFGATCVAEGEYSFAEGCSSKAKGKHSHAEGNTTSAEGDYSHAEGYESISSGTGAHAEGYRTLARYGFGAHAEGYYTKANWNASHAEGEYTESTSGHAEGYGSISSGTGAHAEGYFTKAETTGSHSEGYYTIANNFGGHAGGKYNRKMVTGASNQINAGDVFVLGNGYLTENPLGEEEEFLSNCFRITYEGTVYSKGAYNTSGADYAEYFEWEDGNLNEEDRCGYFVTIEGEKIKIADAASDYILGIISGNPCIIGNADEDWYNRWLRDEFGRPIKEKSSIDITESVFDIEEGKSVYKKTGETKEIIMPIQNPVFDPELEYIERKDRKEWSTVGMMGVLPVRDNGECKVNSFCTVGNGGIAVPSTSGYRVIGRVSENVIKVVFK